MPLSESPRSQPSSNRREWLIRAGIAAGAFATGALSRDLFRKEHVGEPRQPEELSAGRKLLRTFPDQFLGCVVEKHEVADADLVILHLKQVHNVVAKGKDPALERDVGDIQSEIARTLPTILQHFGTSDIFLEGLTDEFFPELQQMIAGVKHGNQQSMRLRSGVTGLQKRLVEMETNLGPQHAKTIALRKGLLSLQEKIEEGDSLLQRDLETLRHMLGAVTDLVLEDSVQIHPSETEMVNDKHAPIPRGIDELERGMKVREKVILRHCAEISYRIALDMPGGLRG